MLIESETHSMKKFAKNQALKTVLHIGLHIDELSKWYILGTMAIVLQWSAYMDYQSQKKKE